MDIFVLKLTITPLLMLMVSLAARKWGSMAGGVAAGLPISSGPISIYLAVDHGPLFAQQAALGSLVGLAAVAGSYIAYAIAMRSLSPARCCLLAVIVFALVSITTHEIDQPALIVLLVVAMIIAIIHVTRQSGNDQALPPRPRWDMALRMLASVVLVLTVTGFSGQLGPTVSGLLAPIPVVAWPLIVFAHLQGGTDGARAAIRGTTIGIPSVMIFYLLVYGLIHPVGPLNAYIWAFLGSSLGAALGIAFLAFWDANLRRQLP